MLPAASAGPSFHAAISSGKFHGTISPTTPSGSRTVNAWPPATGMVSPSGRSDAPRSSGTCRTTMSISPRASAIGFPALRASSCASSSWLVRQRVRQRPQLRSPRRRAPARARPGSRLGPGDRRIHLGDAGAGHLLEHRLGGGLSTVSISVNARSPMVGRRPGATPADAAPARLAGSSIVRIGPVKYVAPTRSTRRSRDHHPDCDQRGVVDLRPVEPVLEEHARGAERQPEDDHVYRDPDDCDRVDPLVLAPSVHGPAWNLSPIRQRRKTGITYAM